MLRVSTRNERSRTVLVVEGRLSEDYVQVVEACCNEAISTGAIVHLHLRHVSTVDGAGRALLLRLAAKGVRLRGSGVYTSHLIRELTRTGKNSATAGAGYDQDARGRQGTDSPSDD
jgi:ABC-type transporter Mla MlaB component